MAEIVQTTAYSRRFLMVLSSDGRTGATGKTPVVNLLKAGSTTFYVPTGTVQEVGNGFYTIALTTLDTNVSGDLAYHITATDCDDTDFTDQIISQTQAVARPTGTTSDSNLTRNKLVEKALIKVKAIAAGDVMSSLQLHHGIDALNLIVREENENGNHIWTRGGSPSVITLQKDVGVYTVSNGLPSNIGRLETVSYRNSGGKDALLEIMSHKGYEAIENKTTRGDPLGVFLTSELNLAARTLYVYPRPATTPTQSEVLGSDGMSYQCIRGHQAATDNAPITGANYLLFWEQGGTATTAWVSGTDYTAPPLLRLWFQRPLSDFDNVNDEPDVPSSKTRQLLYMLAADLSDDYSRPMEERTLYAAKVGRAEERLFEKTRQEATTQIHNKATYS